MQDDSRGAAGAAIALRPAPFWTPTILLIILSAAGAAGGFLFGRLQVGAQPAPRELLLLAALMLIVVVVVAIVRWRTRSSAAPAIVLAPDALHLPRAAHSLRTRAVPYADVLSVDVFGKGKRSRVLVNTHRKLFVYPLGSFAHADPVSALREGIRSALTAQGASTLIQQMDQREKLGKQAWLVQPAVTIGLLISIGIVFLFELWSGALAGTFTLVGYGANAPALVWDGQWFRLFSANFLHLNALHLYMNAIALFSLGLLLEKLTGSWRFTCIYLFSALGGSLASALAAQAAFSVGASTAIYGLFGALAVLNWKHRAQLPSGFRQTSTWWIFIVALNVLLAALLPAIDIAAHAGGAVVGALTTLALYRGDVIRVEPRPGRTLRLMASAAAGVFAVACGVAVFHARTQPAETDLLMVAHDFVNSAASRPAALNSYAWNVCLDEQATDAELQLALQAAGEAVARHDDVDFIDTQAALLFRTGQVDEAVRTELRALTMKDNEFFWRQLTRFLAHRVREQGPLMPARATPPELAMEEPGNLVLRGTAGCIDGCTIYTLVKQGDAVTGLLHLGVGPAPPPQLSLPLDQVPGEQHLPRNASLELALFEVGACRGCERGGLDGRHVRLTEESH